MTTCFKCGAEVAETARFCGSCGALITDPHSATVVVEESPEQELSRLRRVFVGEFDIECELARGGMGVIYKATEAGVGRTVALKLLAPELGVSGRVAERFRREARMVAGLEHPNIVPVYRVGQIGGLLFIAMKYIEGRAIDSIVETQGALPIPVVLHVVRAATRGLAYAHERGIVHRDIKGGNLLADREGRVLLSDFGVALRSSDLALTQDGTVIGTPPFMSPEQCLGKRAEPQSDQYSLGIVTFQMLAGTTPYHADTIAGYIQHHLRTPSPDMRLVRDDVPAALHAWIDHALAKDAADRFPTTNDMLAAIEAIPFSESDRRVSQDLLRRLASGDAVARVQTREFAAVSERATMLVRAGARRRWRAGTAAAAGLVILGALLVAQLDGFWSDRPPEAIAPAAAPPSPPLPPPAPTPGVSPGALRLLTSPPTARILIDGAPVGVLGSAFDVPVAAGPRRLQVRAAGYRSFDTTITVRPGAQVNLRRIELRPLGESP